MVGNRQPEVFPIREENWESKMKTITPTTLPHLHGLVTKYPDIFMFKFVVVCRTYYYTKYE